MKYDTEALEKILEACASATGEPKAAEKFVEEMGADLASFLKIAQSAGRGGMIMAEMFGRDELQAVLEAIWAAGVEFGVRWEQDRVMHEG